MKKTYDTLGLIKTLAVSLLALIIIVLVCNCVPKAVVVEPITPAVVKARAQVRAASAAAARVQSQVSSVHQQSQSMVATAGKLEQEADRLRRLPGVPLDEFTSLWTLVTDLHRETFAHEISARDTVRTAADQQRLQAASESSLSELETTAAATDKGVETLKAQVIRQTDNAALGKAVKSVVVIVVVLALIAIIAWGLSKTKLI